MEFSILGYKMRLEVVIICMLIGSFISCNTFCSCAGGIKEGFQAGTELMGAAIDYTMGRGVPGSYATGANIPYTYGSWYKGLEGNTKGLPVPLPKDQLAIFAENKIDPGCCPSTYSSSLGCICATPEQMKYLNERGGNRTFSTSY